ncbi:hypothetical protein T492DRAFT_858302, partial [Pavlovales sp. CCMP2436]
MVLGPKTLCSNCSQRFRSDYTAAPPCDSEGKFLPTGAPVEGDGPDAEADAGVAAPKAEVATAEADPNVLSPLPAQEYGGWFLEGWVGAPTSERLEARAGSLRDLTGDLTGDPLRAVLILLDDADLPCARLVCRAFREHSSPAQKKCRVDFLRTRTLTVFAWESLPGFVVAHPPPCQAAKRMLRLAASIGCVEVLVELVDNRQCPLIDDACAAAAGKGHLRALSWLHYRGCRWFSGTCSIAAKKGHLEVLR